MKRASTLVMAGLDPAIHVFPVSTRQYVDARDKPGHDGGEGVAIHVNDGVAMSLIGRIFVIFLRSSPPAWWRG